MIDLLTISLDRVSFAIRLCPDSPVPSRAEWNDERHG